MYNKVKLLSIFISVFISLSVVGQNVDPNAYGYYTDAINYSHFGLSGSSRTLGIGGASTAIVGDISNIWGNPAGLGMKRNSEFSFAPAINIASTKSSFLGESQTDGRLNLNFNSLALVFSGIKDPLQEGVYRGGTFGISYARINNFQNQYSYSGNNNLTSITDYYAESASGMSAKDMGDSTNPTSIAQMAYWGYLINPVGNNNNYTTAIYGEDNNGNEQFSGFPVIQNHTVKTTGAQYQWNFSYGGNINEKFCFGISLGLPSIRNTITKTFSESMTNPNPIKSTDLTQYLRVTGKGINFKAGILIKPADFINIGLSAQSASYYLMKNEYYYNAASTYNPGATISQSSSSFSTPVGTYNYSLRTPGRYNGAITFIIGKHGFITGEGEYVNYSNGSLGITEVGDKTNFKYDNRTIKNIYQNTWNLKVGGEYRYDILRLRGGFAYIDSPFKKELIDAKISQYNNAIYNITGGIGIKQKDYYIDLSVVHSLTKRIDKPYTLFRGDEPTALIQMSNTNLVVTTGFLF